MHALVITALAIAVLATAAFSQATTIAMVRRYADGRGRRRAVIRSALMMGFTIGGVVVVFRGSEAASWLCLAGLVASATLIRLPKPPEGADARGG